MFRLNDPLLTSRQRNASSKARTERPTCIQTSPDSYSVYGSDTYTVRFFQSDGQHYAHCECEAGMNGKPCYHVMRAFEDFYLASFNSRNIALGKELLNRVKVGNLGTIATPQAKPANSEIHILSPGQQFTAAVRVKLTVEPA